MSEGTAKKRPFFNEKDRHAAAAAATGAGMGSYLLGTQHGNQIGAATLGTLQGPKGGRMSTGLGGTAGASLGSHLGEAAIQRLTKGYAFNPVGRAVGGVLGAGTGALLAHKGQRSFQEGGKVAMDFGAARRLAHEFRHPLIGAGVGAVGGGLLGGWDTHQVSANGKRLRTPRKRSTRERLAAGAAGAAGGALIGGVAGDSYRTLNSARAKYRAATGAASEVHTARTAARGYGTAHDTLKTQRDVTRAYRKGAMKHHPDRNPGNAAAAQKFQDLAAHHEDVQKSKWFQGLEKGASFGVYDFFFAELERLSA
jgi:hypothetical protein